MFDAHSRKAADEDDEGSRRRCAGADKLRHLPQHADESDACSQIIRLAPLASYN